MNIQNEIITLNKFISDKIMIRWKEI